MKNHNDLVDAFSEVEPNIFYVDFEKASESDELLDIMKRSKRWQILEMIFAHGTRF